MLMIWASQQNQAPVPPEGFEFVTQDAEIVTQDGDPVYVPEEV